MLFHVLAILMKISKKTHARTLKNHKHIGFLSNTGPDPLKNEEATKPAFNDEPSSARPPTAI